MLTLLSTLALAGPVDGRLTDPLRPTAETVELDLDPSRDRYTGKVSIALQIDSRVEAFTLHAEGLTIESASITQKKTRPARFELDGPFLTIHPAKPLKPGEATLEIVFSNDLGTDIAGLYKTTQKGHTYIVTQFEADDARTAFPCFDEPAFKIPWTVKLSVPDDLVAVSNMPVDTVTKGARYFQTSPPLSSYLVAMAVGPYEVTEVADAPVPVTLYTPVGTAPQTAEMAKQIPQHLVFLEDWFGQALPYPKLDFVVVPEFSYGGMENPGLVVLNNVALLDPDTATTAEVANIAEVLSHEIAHMWFGDYVTMQWWDDLWLNESFASWMGLKARADLLPDDPSTMARVTRAYRAMRADGRATMRPVRTEVDPANVFETTNFIAYPKGQALLSVIERWLGEDAFRAGLHRYLERHGLKNATAADLFAALSEGQEIDVGAVLGPYLDEPGAPELLFTRVESGFQITQSRYQLIGSEVDSSTTWTVPLIYKTAAGEHRLLVDSSDKTLQTEAEWLLPTSDGVGYFVWSFADPADLDALLAQADALTPAEQVALVANLQNLTAAGELELGALLEAFARMPEVSLAAQRRMLSTLATVEDVVQPDQEEAFARYLRDSFGPRLRAIGLEPDPSDSPEVRKLRSSLLSWLGEHGKDPEVLALWSRTAVSFLDSPADADLDIAARALLSYAETQDTAFQDRMLGLANSTDNPALHNLYLRAFGSVDSDEARARAVAWATHEDRVLDDIFVVVSAAYSDPDRYGDAQLDWAIENYDLLVAKMPPQYQAYMVSWGGGCDLERLERAQNYFLAPERIAPGAERVSSEAEERTRACVERRKLHGPSLETLLAGYR